MRSLKTKLMTATAAFAVMSIAPAMAASDTLKVTPLNNNYNNAANWSGGNIPGSGDIAFFGDVDPSGVFTLPAYSTFFSADTTVGTFGFLGATTAHVINVDDGRTLTFNGSGVSVSSTSQLPYFQVAAGSVLTFNSGTSASATTSASRRVVYSIGGDLVMASGSSAGNANIQISANTGTANFNGTASAESAIILNGNVLNFNNNSTAANSTITNNSTGTITFVNSALGGNAAILNKGVVTLTGTSSADNAIITMVDGGDINFDDDSEGGTARIILTSGNGLNEQVNFAGQTGAAGSTVTIGSIEGGDDTDRVVIDSVTRLRIGGNNFVDARSPSLTGTVTLGARIVGGGAGSGLDKVGSGQLILTNTNNSFTGPIRIDAGKLTVSADSILGNAANTINFHGGTLRTTGSFATNRTFTLNAGAGTIETDSLTSLRVTTAIGEAGGARALTKAGGGDLILSGANTYTGGTAINAGRVLIGDAGTTGSLSATGDVTIASGGTLIFNRSDALAFTNNITGQGNVGKFAAGTTTMSGTNTYSGTTFVSDGLLIASGGSAIGDASDVFLLGGDLQILANETIGSLNGGEGDTLDIGTSTITLAGGTQNPAVFLGDITGTGNVIKTGSYTQVFDTSPSYTGDTTVNGGTLRVNGTLQGNVIVNQPGNFGGNATVNGNLTNNGGNIAPGNSPGIVDVGGDYTGVGAPTYTVDFFANQVGSGGEAGDTHDLLNIDGSYLGANTQLLLNPTGAAVATTGDGFRVARVGGTSQSDDFFLSTAAQTAQNGFYQGFQYVVNYVPGVTDSFFLQSQVREEIVANATALAASRQVTRDCFRGSIAPASGGQGKDGRGWLNVKVGSFNSDAENGADFDTNYNCVSGGFDVPVGSNVSVGIRGGYANSDVDLKVVQGLAQMDAVTWNVEAAVTLIQGGFYAGLTGGWTAHDWDYDHALASGNSSSETFDGFTGSLFAGYRAVVGKDSNLTFEGLVSYDGTDCDSNCFLAGTQEDISEWEGRLLGRYDTKVGGVMPYLQVSLSHDFGDGQTAFLGNAISNVDIASLLMGADIGVMANLGGNWMGTFNLGTTQGFDSEVDGYNGAIGVKTTW